MKAWMSLNFGKFATELLPLIDVRNNWGGGKAALGFGPDRIGTLVSMATDSSHRVIMGKML